MGVPATRNHTSTVHCGPLAPCILVPRLPADQPSSPSAYFVQQPAQYRANMLVNGPTLSTNYHLSASPASDPPQTTTPTQPNNATQSTCLAHALQRLQLHARWFFDSAKPLVTRAVHRPKCVAHGNNPVVSAALSSLPLPCSHKERAIVGISSIPSTCQLPAYPSCHICRCIARVKPMSW